MGRILLVFMAAIATAVGASLVPPPAVISNDKIKQLDALLSWPADVPDELPGFALGVYVDGELVYTHCEGMANLEHRIPITPDTTFSMGMLSSHFTAACAHLLAGEGKLTLDDDVREYTPRLMENIDDALTIQHLLNYTSGLRNYRELMSLSGRRAILGSQESYDEFDVYKMLRRQRALCFTPGDDIALNRTDFYLLGKIVARAARRGSLRVYAEGSLFKPLGMHSTVFHNSPTRLVPDRADGYMVIHPDVSLFNSPLTFIGDDGLFTSIRDLEKWERNLITGEVGGEDFVQAMLRNGARTDGTAIHAAGAMLDKPYRGMRCLQLMGFDSYSGFHCTYVRFPDHGVAIAVLANTLELHDDELALRAADILLRGELEPVPPKPEITPHRGGPMDPSFQPSEFDGAYVSRDMRKTLLLRSEDGGLTMNYALQFRRVNDTEFVGESGDQDVRLRFNMSDGITAVEVFIDGELYGSYVRSGRLPKDKPVESFCGAYHSDELDASLKVWDERGSGMCIGYELRLIAKPEYLGDDLFGDRHALTAVKRLFQFHRDASGRVTGFTLEHDGARGIMFHRTDE